MKRLLVCCLAMLAFAVPQLSAATPSTAVTTIVPTSDVHATAVAPTTNYAEARSMVVDGNPQTESFLAFNLADVYGSPVDGVELRLSLKDAAGAGVGVYRIGKQWYEDQVTWDTRPQGGELVATVDEAMPSGGAVIDLAAAFPTGVIDRRALALRIATTSGNGFVFWSSEGQVPPVLAIVPAAGEPTPGTTPTPTPLPTPSPAARRFYFRGHGSDHGVGMSQYGARGRANAGQTHEQILAHYYSGTALGTIPANQLVRVQLTPSYTPTATLPARITARGGAWTSPALLDGTGRQRRFPADSHAQMVPAESGAAVTVYDTAGTQLARARVDDLTMLPADATTLFEMGWRPSLVAYDLYRGEMRIRRNGAGVQAINTVTMDDYLKGVVPAEVPPLWPFEAVKAQAVAARSYAYVRLAPDRLYDVVPTASNQVYGGVRIEHPRSNLAVDRTSRQVVMAGGRVANTFFFTVGGGYTENNEYVWVGNNGRVIADPISYLRGVPDTDESGRPYDRDAPGYAWTTDSFSWEQLDRMLAADPRTRVGRLVDLKFERGVSGRVYRVTIAGSDRTVSVSGPVFKGVFNNERLSVEALRSTMFYLERTR